MFPDKRIIRAQGTVATLNPHRYSCNTSSAVYSYTEVTSACMGRVGEPQQHPNTQPAPFSLPRVFLFFIHAHTQNFCSRGQSHEWGAGLTAAILEWRKEMQKAWDGTTTHP